jgi:hypothetical protein
MITVEKHPEGIDLYHYQLKWLVRVNTRATTNDDESGKLVHGIEIQVPDCLFPGEIDEVIEAMKLAKKLARKEINLVQ